jgi:hypothetical protein
MLHYKACARTWKQKAADIALGVFGMVAAIYTTVQTLVVSAIALTLSALSHTFLDSSWHSQPLLLHQ